MINVSCRAVSLLRTKSRSVGWLVYWGCFEREKDKFCLAGFCAVLCYGDMEKATGSEKTLSSKRNYAPLYGFFFSPHF